MNTKLHFYGAAGCVTGSCMLLDTAAGSLLVDCGMFQGSKTLKALNYRPFPFDVSKVKAVLLTHAHIDHSGLLPKLVRAGYRGPILATHGTVALCEVMLPDAGAIQEMEVEQLNRRNQRHGQPEVQPIYTRRDAEQTQRYFRSVDLGAWTEIAPGVRARYWNAGHILGAASIELEVTADGEKQTLLFSGDVGPGGSDFVDDPSGPSGVDHLVSESTYGGTVRARTGPDQRRAALIKELRDAHAAGGPLLIPAFAVERTQELVVDLLEAMESNEAPPGIIFIDSPLAVAVTEVYQRYGRKDGANPFARLREAGRLQFTETPAESKALERVRGWHVIVSASGMADAGRVRHHLKRLLWRPEATVMLVGYQAVGTLGRLLQEGKTDVRIQGEEFKVRARIRSVSVYSGHADAEALTAWVKARAPVRGGVFLTHGEPESSESFRARLIENGFAADRVIAAEIDRCYMLAANAAPVAYGQAAPPRLPPRAASRLDWHNARAEFLMQLQRKIDAAKDDAAREALFAQLSEALR
ncbi:MAG TPA: MBL fold metallo-hydrolase [Caulobacterales bacterium]|nr:MBL fold metallo-hydrolase [Caulobacterales bacterium]